MVTFSTWDTKTLQTLDFSVLSPLFLQDKNESHKIAAESSFYNQSCSFNYAITSSFFSCLQKDDDPIFKSRKKADAKNRKDNHQMSHQFYSLENLNDILKKHSVDVEQLHSILPQIT